MNFYRRKKVSWFILSFLFIICRIRRKNSNIK